ncbi:phosphatase PAP2 family protein [Streptomyces albus]
MRGGGGVRVRPPGVAFTRVWLGVHWLTDTVVGVLLGAALGLASAAVWATPRTAGQLPAPPVRFR